MEPVVEKILQGIPFAGMGTALERNGLIGVVRELIKSNKYTVDYILNYCESVGYQRNMAEEVFEELTGLSPKLIINNNEYYNAPIYVPACTIAWGMAKSKRNVAFYVVPGSYGYSVMEKNETDVPTEVIQTATIPEAIDELKKVAKKIQTLDKIITSKLLETEDVATIATDPNQIAKPYAAVDPVFELKKNFKNKVIDINGFEREAKRLVAEEKISLEDAEDLLNWEQDVINEDESYANEVLQNNEEWKPLEAEEDIPFDKIYEEFKAISSEDEDILGGKDKAEALYKKNKSLFKDCDLLQCAERLYQLMLGFSKEEILGRYNFLNKTINKSNKKIKSDMDLSNIPGVKFIWHGNWSDPEIQYEGYSFSYWEIEDALYKDYEDYHENNEDFNTYVKNNIKFLLDDYIANGYGEKIKASKKVTSSKIIQVNVYDIDWNFDELDEEDKPTEKLPDFYNNLNIEIDEDAEDFEMTKDDIKQMIDDSISKELFNEFGYYPESYNWTYSNKKESSKKVKSELNFDGDLFQIENIKFDVNTLKSKCIEKEKGESATYRFEIAIQPDKYIVSNDHGGDWVQLSGKCFGEYVSYEGGYGSTAKELFADWPQNCEFSGFFSTNGNKINITYKGNIAEYIGDGAAIYIQNATLNVPTAKKNTASKKVTAENITLEDMEEEDNKSESEKEVEKINETPIDELLEDNTPLDFFEKETQDDKVDTINDVVSKCITEFSDKFKDFDKYDIKMLSYKTKILDPYTPTQDEMIPDNEVNADAVLQVILSVNNKADDTDIKKLLVVFSITDGKMHWTGTVRDEDNNIVAFTEEGLDSIFNEPEEITEDII